MDGNTAHFSSFAENTDLHGFAHLVATKKKAGQVFWVAAMLVAGVVCVIQIFGVISDYSEERTGTEVRAWAPTVIPPISLCPLYYVDTDMVLQNVVDKRPILAETLGVDREVIAALISGYMDSFLAFGLSFSAARGNVDVSSFKADRYKDLKAAIRAVAAAYGVLERYNYSLTNFFEQNTPEIAAVIRESFVSPLVIPHNITKDATWMGVCYKLDFQSQSVNKLQLQWLQIDVKTWPLKKGYVLDPENGSRIDTENYFFVRTGGASFNGITVPKVTAKIYNGLEYDIDVMPRRIERLNLRKRGCRHYTSEEQLYCFQKHRSYFCSCRFLFVDEKLSNDYSDCNHSHKEGFFCMLELLDAPESYIAARCPDPCTLDEYDITVKPPSPINGSLDESRIHFTFSKLAFSVLMHEYKQVTFPVLLSNLGGSMGLFFGASLLALVHAAYCCASWVFAIARRQKTIGTTVDAEIGY